MTIMEMIVVIAILMIISTMIIFNYGKFESSISLQNLADDIALSVREAQSYAIGARGLPGSGFFNGYGIHFSLSDPISTNNIAGSKKSFVFFANVKDDGSYNYSSSDNTCGSPKEDNECYKVISISSADYISNIKKKESVSAEVEIEETDSVDIIFTRPYPEPKLCLDNYCDDSFEYFKIEIKNPRTEESKYIQITNTGQINVSVD